ncbi:MAG: polysaccharide pyruvyl transferase family protein [Planctomycetota bacterium]
MNALLYATVAGVREREPDAKITVMGIGRQPKTLSLVPDGSQSADVLRLDASRRFFAPYATSNLTLVQKTGLPLTRAARAVAAADAMLDVSAGDSFTDLYGAYRFDSICYLKELAVRRGLPLVMLPQTYGPFAAEESKRRAAAIVSRAAIVWSRDERSAKVADELFEIGGGDASRHHMGVDVAFALPKLAASGADADSFSAFRDEHELVAGLNVSGLVYNQSEKSKRDFGLSTDYRPAVAGVLERLLADGRVGVALVPHVVAARGATESDSDACDAAKAALPAGLRERVHVLPELDDPRIIKWYIAQCDWFCGTRMHATIAGLSTGVPTASLSYSMKTLGVFGTCGLADEVFEMQSLPTDEAIERTVGSWERRAEIGRTLAENFPNVLAKTKQQMDSIVETCRAVKL